MRCGAVTTRAPVAWCTLACTPNWLEEVKVCCVLVDPISARILRKETCSLDADFLPASFLGYRSRGAHQDSKNRCHYNLPNHVFPSPIGRFHSITTKPIRSITLCSTT